MPVTTLTQKKAPLPAASSLGAAARPAPVQQATTQPAPATTTSGTARPTMTTMNQAAGQTAVKQTESAAPAQSYVQNVPIQAPMVGGYTDAQGRPVAAPMTSYVNALGQPSVPPSAATEGAARPPAPAPAQIQQSIPQPVQTQGFWDSVKEAWHDYGPYLATPVYYGTEGALALGEAGYNAVTGAGGEGGEGGGGAAQPPPINNAVTNYATDQFRADPAATGPGITGGVMQTQFGGVDMTTPGAAEQFFYDNAWRLALPNALTEGGAWWEQNQAQVGTPGAAEKAYNTVAPSLLNPGGGEQQVADLLAAYGPGNYPTGSNLSSDFAGAYRPTALGKGIGEDVGAAIGQTYRPGETPGASNRADEFYQQFLPNMPDINSDPGLDPYYDNARRKAAEEINRNMAARGMWGSSAAGDLIGEANVNLGAEQANREAQYRLDRLAEQRNWQTTGGQLASSADTSSRGQSENERAWTGELADIAATAQGLELDRAGENRQQTALGSDIMRSADDVTARNAGLERDWAATMGGLGLEGDAASRARASTLLGAANDSQRAMLERLGFGRETAMGIDDAELGRLAAGQSAAASAQNASRVRGQDYFNNTMSMGGAMQGVMEGQYNPMITEDKELLNDILAMLTGSGAERLAGAQRETAGAQQTQNAQQEALLTGILAMFGL
jgi:hypothetical protein